MQCSAWCQQHCVLDAALIVSLIQWNDQLSGECPFSRHTLTLLMLSRRLCSVRTCEEEHARLRSGSSALAELLRFLQVVQQLGSGDKTCWQGAQCFAAAGQASGRLNAVALFLEDTFACKAPLWGWTCGLLLCSCRWPVLLHVLVTKKCPQAQPRSAATSRDVHPTRFAKPVQVTIRHV